MTWAIFGYRYAQIYLTESRRESCFSIRVGPATYQVIHCSNLPVWDMTLPVNNTNEGWVNPLWFREEGQPCTLE